MLRALTLLVVLVPALQEKKQEPTPAELFAAMEKKLSEAKTLTISAKGEFPQGNGNATILAAEGNKLFVDVVPEGESEHVKLAAVSDGTRLKLLDRNAYDVETPKGLKADASKAFARMGLMGVGFLVTEKRGEPQGGMDATLKVSDFSKGEPEKVGDRDATVLRYKLSVNDNDMEMKIWIDASTGLPLKRRLTIRKGEKELHANETYSAVKLDEPVDAKKFEHGK